jgi:UDP-glucose:(glucosyl)LPS alpha-1,2-glucosyltransferase
MTEDFFAWNNSYIGGTEVALKWFHKNVLPEMKNLKNYRCISVPGKPTILENVLDNSKKNILWLHLTPNQVDDNGMNVLQMTDFKKTLHKVIAISNFHKKRIVSEMSLDPKMVEVIEYPIDEDITFDFSKFDNVKKPKIIHASQSIRGLEILLRVFETLDEDIELNIYNDFYPEQNYSPALDKIMKDERITFYGKTPRVTFLKELSKSHIHAYPSIFDETSCLVQAEAMLSGNLCVYSNYGSLPETSLGHGIVSDFLSMLTIDEIAEDYKEKLIESINIIKNGKFDPSQQVSDIREKRNKEKIMQKWLDFDKEL